MSSQEPLLPKDGESSRHSSRHTERKLKEIELRKLMLRQTEEASLFELELQHVKKEHDLELRKLENERRLREIKYQTRLAELEMQELDVCSKSDISSRDERLPASPNPIDQIRKTEEWVNSDFTPELETSKMNTNPFTNNDFTPNPITHGDTSRSKIRMNTNPFINNEFTPSPFVNFKISSNPFVDVNTKEPKIERNVENNSQAVMMKLTLLHAMRPVKFCGDPADYPIFRERVRTHLEDGLLAESQKVEFLNKFIEGEVVEVLKRVSGCPYDKVISVLYERYGHPAKVAAACLKNIINGPKLANTDYTGLQNFAETLESATNRLTGEYEQEASTMSNMKLIIARLPSYLINKWGDNSYNLRMNNATPKLRNLCEFVKKQAKIKNDPLFSAVSLQSTVERKPERQKQYTGYSYKPNREKQTSTFLTNTSSSTQRDKSTYVPNRTQNDSSKTKLKCPYCCGNNHLVPQCGKFQDLDIQNRWDFVKKERLCHACLLAGHFRTACTFQNYCTCTTERKHHPLLHNDRGVREQYNQTFEKQKPETKSNYATFVHPLKKAVLLHVSAVALVSPDGNIITTYGLIDNASRGSIIGRDMARHMKLKGRKELVSINTIIGSETQEYEIVNFGIQSVSNDSKLYGVEAIISDSFNICEKYLPHDINLQDYEHLADIKLPDVDIKEISILIGKDVDGVHDIYEFRKSPNSDKPLHGILGPLGWVITGTLGEPVMNKEVNVNYIDYNHDYDLNDMVKKFWKIEDSGINRSNVSDKSLSIEDKRAIDIMEKTTVLSDGHYETGLLWKNDNGKLPNNKPQAEHRLASLKRRFERDSDYRKTYFDNMNDSIFKEHARKLSESEVLSTSDRTWYLPHFGVVNPKKPGKLRIVFDAAAQYQGTSLNKNLLPGPDRTNNLVGVILRFRQENIALSADIQGMFHQIKVREQDQDSLRFLWWDSDDINLKPSEYAFCRHIFGATDSPCIATSALRKTASDNKKLYNELTIKTVGKDFYVDDLLTSVPTVGIAIELGHNLSDLCEKGGFNLIKFNSNSKEVLSTFPAEKLAKKTIDLDFEELSKTKALGIQWNVENDTLGFDVVDLQKPNTMRGVLSTICSVFDPLSIIAPVLLPAKLIMQELWRKQWKWDKPLEGQLLDRWLKWKNNLYKIEHVKIQRCYFSNIEHSNCTIQLHHFSDSSEFAYGSVSFLRIKYDNEEIECRFIIGKSRNAPLKVVSIPRLELQAAVLATRMNTFIVNELELKFESITFWTDSMIVLNYINNTNRRFKTFVANRVTEIHESTITDQWKYCPGTENPADDVSRGMNPEQLNIHNRWLSGPEFLRKPESEWTHSQLQDIPLDKLEIKKEVNFTNIDSESSLLYMYVIQKYSNWTKCLRAFAWLIKFVDWIGLTNVERSKMNKTLSLKEIELAKRKIIGLVQNECFGEDMKALKSNTSVKSSSSIISLKPVLRDNVICVGGRISKAPISLSAMHPMIIPRKNHLTKMIIRHIHETNGHCPREETLSIIREEFWIVGGRAAVSETVGSCIVCKKHLSPTLRQQMCELPSSRLTPFEPCFTYTGADLFGPILVKRGRGRVMEKRWGVLFTCMNSRAVHLEVARSLETDDFILTLIRFLNRRGHVKELRTDNGSNFVGADKELRDLCRNLKNEQIERDLSKRGVKWIFHTPLAPHTSGVWESLVKVVKRSLKTVLKEPVTDEILQTVFTEAEYIANNRPLTKNPMTPYDCEPLTPNHFLNIRPSLNIPPGIVSQSDRFHKKRWRQAQLLSEHYWKRWLKEYIPSLQNRQKWHQVKENLCKGDLVLLVSENLPRSKWLLGRIENVFKGPDGLVRSAEVKTKNGIFKRPITRLCFVEAHNSDL